MEVFALVGKSGTGKSYQAINFCHENNIVSIIDDGLFIVNNELVAGKSAKGEATKVGAIKTALFTDLEHRAQVARRIKEINPESLVILGTSIGMVEKIAEVLDLPKIKKITMIEDITTKSERDAARKQRVQMGKHVIPVPTFEIKREFSGYFIDPLKIFRGLRLGKKDYTEKTEVRPTYSYLGDYTISETVITDIVNRVSVSIPQITAPSRINVTKVQDGIKIGFSISIENSKGIIEMVKQLQYEVVLWVEHMTAFNVQGVDVEIRELRS